MCGNDHKTHYFLSFFFLKLCLYPLKWGKFEFSINESKLSMPEYRCHSKHSFLSGENLPNIHFNKLLPLFYDNDQRCDQRATVKTASIFVNMLTTVNSINSLEWSTWRDRIQSMDTCIDEGTKWKVKKKISRDTAIHFPRQFENCHL